VQATRDVSNTDNTKPVYMHDLVLESLS
jgi:hypothetical protein